MATKKKKASKGLPASAKKKPAKKAKKPGAAKPKAARATKRPVAAKKAARATKKAAKSARPLARAAKKRPAPSPAAKAAPIHRRDGAGHLDPKYAATLREKSREGRVRDRDDAFIGRSGRSSDNLAEAMGETWVETATSGEDENEEVFNQSVPEDEGGPFVTTTAGQEFAEGTDASNPKRSKREAFPKT